MLGPEALEGTTVPTGQGQGAVGRLLPKEPAIERGEAALGVAQWRRVRVKDPGAWVWEIRSGKVQGLWMEGQGALPQRT